MPYENLTRTYLKLIGLNQNLLGLCSYWIKFKFGSGRVGWKIYIVHKVHDFSFKFKVYEKNQIMWKVHNFAGNLP